ncbi:DUF4760 domain-containing protein [Saccharophagus sp. K07]|jgi:hypothetical protein|uniref:DUF4760 domain-containing protein n=1 Tax=Saccharophagus sp. K07 TaxID=2283636 RepID=UPI0016523F9B|nr:DUF4760 domain-containing protein [Saccharophagus sp. K07]MBC6907073.1 DUF4760 domain-containing protein [Saccharophagus sp. K07]
MNFEWTALWQFFSGVGGLCGVVVAFVALGQLKEMKRSLDDARRWNKLNSAFSYLPKSHEFIEIEKELNNSFLNIIDRTSPLTEAEVSKLFDDEHRELRVKLKSYLNLLESFCTAIEMGAVDEDAAREMYSHKFKRHYCELLPYIKHMRATLNESRIFSSLETVVDSWDRKQPVPKKY